MKVVLTLMVIAMMLGSGCGKSPPAERGLKEGRLAPCPNSPNCVSSMEQRPSRFIAPIGYEGGRTAAHSRLLKGITTLGGDPVEVQKEYIRAEFASRIFGFIDDVEFYFLQDEPLIHVRSAARTGYWDFGVNRRRVEELRQRMLQSAASADER